MERDILEKLLSQYSHANFKKEEVQILIDGGKLPSSANTTLLDIEQSLKPHGESVKPFIASGSSGNDNTE